MGRVGKNKNHCKNETIWQEYLDIEEREKALLKENDRSLYFIVIEDEYLRQGASLSSLAKRFPKIKNYVTNTKKAFDTQEEKQRSNEKIFRTFLEKLESLPTKQHIEYTEGVL
jgi:5'-deoxynucleotidase YfbR-like HD superfamily hydrolase